MPDMPLSPWQQTEPPGELQVLWFERRVNLETSTRGLEESEREVRGREVTEGTLEGGLCSCAAGFNTLFRPLSHYHCRFTLIGAFTGLGQIGCHPQGCHLCVWIPLVSTVGHAFSWRVQISTSEHRRVLHRCCCWTFTRWHWFCAPRS